MKKVSKIFAILLIFASMPVLANAKDKEEDETVRAEREYIRSGNKLYEEERYAEAEVEYKKALSVNPNSYLANYNLALSLIKQSGDVNPEVEEASNPLKTATELLNSVAQNSKNDDLRAHAYYNMGNIAFNQQQYDQSIEMYKSSLRINPDDEQTRENLRLAQLKKNEQKQDKNKDKNKDKKDDKQEQDQNENNQNKNENKQQQQQRPQPQQQDLSKDNMEQILKTMQNQEKATQEKVNAQKPQNVRKTGNQW